MKTRSIWRYERLRDYRAPEMRTRESLRSQFAMAWKQFLAPRKEDHDTEREFGQLSSEQEEAIVPTQDWNGCFDAVTDLTRLQQRQLADTAVTLIVGPPGSGVTEVLTGWARREGAELLQPPEPADLLKDLRLVHSISDAEHRLVIPAVHRFYLRHPAGLRAVRRLLTIIRGSRRQILIGCDSWAWSYLCRAVQIDAMLPSAFTLAPLTGKCIRAWVSQLGGGQDSDPDRFQFTDDDAPVFAPNDERDARESAEIHPEFFDDLASTARGIPQVALELWKNCLRTVQDPDDGAGGNGREMIWVKPLGAVELPVVPANTSRVDAIVLHSLLLHAGLAENLLQELIPFDSAQVIRSLTSLKRLALVDEVDGFWSVRHLAYPNVRRFLAGECFLIDEF